MTPHYLTPAEYAALHHVCRQLVDQWLQADRLPFAFKVGRHWNVPADCPRPEKQKPGRKIKLTVPITEAEREWGRRMDEELLAPRKQSPEKA